MGGVLPRSFYSTSKGRQLSTFVHNGDRSSLQAVLAGGVEKQDLETCPPLGATALQHAAALGRVGCLSDLIMAGADVEHRDWDGTTPLCIATMEQQPACVSLLLWAGADVNAANNNEQFRRCGWTPLHLAASEGDVACVTMLLAAGAKLLIVARDGTTPLYWACENDFTAVVALMQSESRWRRRRALALIREQRQAGRDWGKARKEWRHSKVAKH